MMFNSVCEHIMSIGYKNSVQRKFFKNVARVSENTYLVIINDLAPSDLELKDYGIYTSLVD